MGIQRKLFDVRSFFEDLYYWRNETAEKNYKCTVKLGNNELQVLGTVKLCLF